MADSPRVVRRALSFLAVIAAVAALLLGAMAAGLLGGSSADSKGPRAKPEPERTSTSTPTPTPTVAPAAAPLEPRVVTMPRSAPVRLRIPAIRVDSELMDLGLQKDGTLEVPPGAFPAGWFKGAPTPGELGPAVIVGHVRFETPGVFARLTDLRRDDEINVARKDGSTAAFRVTRVEHFAKAAFPSQKVYGNIDHAGLRLITCGGLDADTNKFDENVVVFAELES